MFFFKRYVLDYIIISILMISGWIYLIWQYEGIIPISFGMIFGLFVICYIPYLIYSDYQKIKELYIDYKKLKNDEISQETFNKNFLIKISDEFGIPEFISSPILNKIIKEKIVVWTLHFLPFKHQPYYSQPWAY